MPRMVDWLLRRLIGEWPDPDQERRIERTRRAVVMAEQAIPEIRRVAALRESYRRSGQRLNRRAGDPA